MKLRFRIVLSATFALGLGLGVLLGTDLFKSLSTNLRTYNNVVKQLISDYVDEIDSERMIDASVRGMLGELDPYTVFIREEDKASLDILTRGKYGGVGIQIGVRNDTLTVIAPMEGSPAYRAGIQSGDKIIKIDSIAAQDLRLDEAARKIRGEIGTTITLTLFRFGESELIVVPLVRDEITVNDMPYYGVDDGVGYIRITRFSKNTAEDFRKAVSELNQQGMTGLVLDLRDNPGGLLQDAVAMVDAVVEPGQLILETRGRTKAANRKYYSEMEPVLPQAVPLVVLVNQGSASASEIVAGAIQDLDRGVIIGKRTFGKGLVQSIYPVGRKSSLKLTTAKYYIPSGRLIQKEDYLHNGVLTDGLDKHDSTFVTLSGRTVRGGGGIQPDVEVEPRALPPLTRLLWQHSLFFSFATQHKDDDELAMPLEITGQMLADFRQFMDSKSLEFVYPGEREIDKFEEFVNKLEEFSGELQLGDIESYFDRKRQSAFDDEEEFIRRGILLEITAMRWGLAERIHAALPGDPGYQTAVQTLSDSEQYSRILLPGHPVVIQE